MNLTLHIVRKDLRRMAWPAGLWVGFVAVAAIWFCIMRMPEESVPARELFHWINGVRNFVLWVVAMQVVTNVLLAGHLVLEDAVVGTTAFWQTRPVARGRLLAAKLIAGGLLLIAAPTMVLVPVWLASGFSVGDVAEAGGEFAALQIAILVIAFGLASLANSLAQFFFSAAGVAVIFVFVASPAMGTWWGHNAGPAVETSRLWLTFLAPVPFMAFVLVHQFLSRRTRSSWVMIAIGLVALHAVRVSWPLDLTPRLPSALYKPWPAAEIAGDLASIVAVKKIVTPFDRNLPYAAFLEVVSGPVTGGFLAPQTGKARLHWPDQRVAAFSLARGGLWGEDAAQRLAGLKRDEGPILWGMAAHFHEARDLQAMPDEPKCFGQLGLERMHGHVLAELPLRAGVRARERASDIRIVGVGEGVNYDPPCIVVEERDPLFVTTVGFTGGSSARAADDSRQDCFLLVNRALGIVKCLHIVEVGSVNMNSLLVSVRQLEVSSPGQIVSGQRVEFAEWRNGAVLIKVRFESERRLTRTVTTERVALVAEEEKK